MVFPLPALPLIHRRDRSSLLCQLLYCSSLKIQSIDLCSNLSLFSFNRFLTASESGHRRVRRQARSISSAVYAVCHHKQEFRRINKNPIFYITESARVRTLVSSKVLRTRRVLIARYNILGASPSLVILCACTGVHEVGLLLFIRHIA